MSALVNRARGETMLLVGGKEQRLCLTLGALASLEAAFETDSLEELGARLQRLSANDLLIVVAALAQGGGTDISPAALARAQIDPTEAARAVAEAIAGAFADD